MKQLKLFEEILLMLRSKKIKVVLVYVPIPKPNFDSYTNNMYFDTLMSKYSEYYNFNRIISLNDSLHFFDSHHLNQKGVELFNKKLIRLIDEKKIFRR